MPSFPGSDERLVLAPDCRRCPALAECRTEIAWGVGPTDADVVVVGEAPAAGDPAERAAPWHGGNHTGMAYTSRHSGRRIRALLAAAGYPDAFYTNAVKCFPAAPEDPSTNREPTAEERTNCREHLLAELETVDPAVVVPTGKHATTSLFAAADRDLDGFLDAALTPVELPALGATAVPLLHPSYQDVWRGRLGYDDAAAYRDAVARALVAATG
jgi:uracil-DNA glycosylase family 4